MWEMNDYRPLAEVLRPNSLDDVVGQAHIVGTDGILRKLLESNFLPSLVLWGPPGSGKTTIAKLLATLSKAHFESHSAVTAKLEDIRKVVKEAKERLHGEPEEMSFPRPPAGEAGRRESGSPIRSGMTEGQRTILFIDEIHRFNKAQQDALLPHVEDGTVIFIGATTENPSFEIISPLLSRCRVLLLKQLDEIELNTIIDRALTLLKYTIADDARIFLIQLANGDARALITILEIATSLQKSGKKITVQLLEEASQKKTLQYDTKGEEHYNTISAFIKSMRASQIDAALYYLARMVEGGEDPLFIARRMVIFASEDIGLAQPTALVVANAVFDGCHKVGYPEAQILLAHGVSYLSQAKKDRSAYDAFFAALDDVKKFGNLPIPLNVRNAPTKLMKELGYGKGYTKYNSDSYLPEKVKGKRYYKQ